MIMIMYVGWLPISHWPISGKRAIHFIFYYSLYCKFNLIEGANNVFVAEHRNKFEIKKN